LTARRHENRQDAELYRIAAFTRLRLTSRIETPTGRPACLLIVPRRLDLAGRGTVARCPLAAFSHISWFAPSRTRAQP
jgi:hypothetical protein